MSEKRYSYFSLEKLKIGDEEEYAPNLWTAIPDSCVGFMASASKRYRRPIAEPPCEHIFRLNGKCSKCGADYQDPVVKDSLTAEEPMQELITCPHGALHTVKCGKCENDGEVGTPRTDDECFDLRDIGENGGVKQDDQLVHADFARQLERELICSNNRREELRNRNQELQHLAVGHQIAQEAALENSDDNLRRLMAAEKERDEWRDLAGRLAYKPAHTPICCCAKCEDWHAALAAYELKAKENL